MHNVHCTCTCTCTMCIAHVICLTVVKNRKHANIACAKHFTGSIQLFFSKGVMLAKVICVLFCPHTISNPVQYRFHVCTWAFAEGNVWPSVPLCRTISDTVQYRGSLQKQCVSFCVPVLVSPDNDNLCLRWQHQPGIENGIKVHSSEDRGWQRWHEHEVYLISREVLLLTLLPILIGQ